MDALFPRWQWMPQGAKQAFGHHPYSLSVRVRVPRLPSDRAQADSCKGALAVCPEEGFGGWGVELVERLPSMHGVLGSTSRTINLAVVA